MRGWPCLLLHPGLQPKFACQNGGVLTGCEPATTVTAWPDWGCRYGNFEARRCLLIPDIRCFPDDRFTRPAVKSGVGLSGGMTPC